MKKFGLLISVSVLMLCMCAGSFALADDGETPISPPFGQNGTDVGTVRRLPTKPDEYGSDRPSLSLPSGQGQINSDAEGTDGDDSSFFASGEAGGERLPDFANTGGGLIGPDRTDVSPGGEQDSSSDNTGSGQLTDSHQEPSGGSGSQKPRNSVLGFLQSAAGWIEDVFLPWIDEVLLPWINGVFLPWVSKYRLWLAAALVLLILCKVLSVLRRRRRRRQRRSAGM